MGVKKGDYFTNVKELFAEEPCLAHYAKNRDDIVTTDASETRLGLTLWQKQSDGEVKPIALGSRYLIENGKRLFNWKIELLAVISGLEIYRFYLYRKKVFLFTDHQALKPLNERNRCKRQNSARLTSWLDWLATFEIAIQHIAGSNRKFPEFF